MKLIRLFTLLALVINCISCAENKLSQENIVWNSESVKFRTGQFGGEGPNPNVLFGRLTELKCQQNSYYYEYDEGILSKSVCTDSALGYEDYEVELSSSELKQMKNILNITFTVKNKTGVECPQDFGGYSKFIEVYQSSGVVNILHDSDHQPCGKNSKEYVYGAINNFDFFSGLDSLIFNIDERIFHNNF